MYICHNNLTNSIRNSFIVHFFCYFFFFHLLNQLGGGCGLGFPLKLLPHNAVAGPDALHDVNHRHVVGGGLELIQPVQVLQRLHIHTYSQ